MNCTNLVLRFLAGGRLKKVPCGREVESADVGGTICEACREVQGQGAPFDLDPYRGTPVNGGGWADGRGESDVALYPAVKGPMTE